MVGLSLANLMGRAERAGRPILLYFPSQVTWMYTPIDERADDTFLNDQVVAAIARNYVFRIYRRGTADGDQAAREVLHRHTIYGEIVVLTAKGEPHVRLVLDGYVPSLEAPSDFVAQLGAWAKAARYRVDDPPAGNVARSIGLQRAWINGNLPMTESILDEVAKDLDLSDSERARASWMKASIMWSRKAAIAARQAAHEHLENFPAYGLPALRLLFAVGAGRDELNSAMIRILSSVRPRGSQGDQERPEADCLGMIEEAILLGAHDAARRGLTEIVGASLSVLEPERLLRVSTALGVGEEWPQAEGRDEGAPRTTGAPTKLERGGCTDCQTFAPPARRAVLTHMFVYPGERSLEIHSDSSVGARQELTAAVREALEQTVGLEGSRIAAYLVVAPDRSLSLHMDGFPGTGMQEQQLRAAIALLVAPSVLAGHVLPLHL